MSKEINLKVTAYQVNAFTQDIHGGNPAGVVLDADHSVVQTAMNAYTN